MQEASQTIGLPVVPAVKRVPEEWPAGPFLPVLIDSEIHVWRVELDNDWPVNLDQALADIDRTQAARFRFAVDRERFLAARASLRTILGRYLEFAPDALQFDLGAHGKPSLAKAQNSFELSFNLTHSHELALIAITMGREIGVDVELMRADFAGDEIAERFFSQAEITQLKSVTPESRLAAFFNCWTRKEAYIKARGEGLSFPLDQFDVSLEPDSPPALLGNRRDAHEVSRWSFEELSPADGYAAALTVEGNFSRLLLWDFPGSAI